MNASALRQLVGELPLTALAGDGEGFDLEFGKSGIVVEGSRKVARSSASTASSSSFDLPEVSVKIVAGQQLVGDG